MEHVQPFNRPFPWRAAALAAAVVALAELTALLALAGAHLFRVHHAAVKTRPVAATGPVPKGQATPLRARSRVSVLVLNGNGISGAAGTKATRLSAAGYRHATAGDASQAYASSLVLFRRGWQREAQRLAHDTGIGAVAPLDVRLPRAEPRYQLVLILGAN